MKKILQKFKDQGNISDMECKLIFKTCMGQFYYHGVTDSDTQKDIMQNVLIKYSRYMGSAENPSAYFRTILKNELKNYGTREGNKAKKKQSIDDAPEIEVPSGIEAKLTYETCLEQLGMDQRMAMAFQLSQEDRKYSEIADVLGIDQRTAKKLCIKAQKLFRQLSK